MMLALSSEDAGGMFCFLCAFVCILAIPFALAITSRRVDWAIRKQAPDFKFTKYMSTRGYQACLVIDDSAGRICIVHKKLLQKPQCHIVPYQDVIEAEIIEGGESVTRISQSGLLGGALGGEMLLGPAGALIGAMGAKRITKTRVTSIELKIVVDDLHQPVHLIRLFSGNSTKGSLVYRQAIKNAYAWHGVASVAIRRGAAIKQEQLQPRRPPVKGL